jgi:putative DNA primase/helicase
MQLDAPLRPATTQQDEAWNQRRAEFIASTDKAREALANSGQADDADVPTLSPPTATPEMFYGLAGEVGRAAAKGTEVNPVAAMGYYMTMLSAAVGRDVYLSIGNTFHHCRLFACHVGRTSRGRKGDAQGAGRRIRNAIDDVFEELGHFHSGGLSSREGLAGAIQDVKEGDAVTGTHDKRLFVVESEFSNTLAQGRREGNTLTAALRDAWDGSDIKPLVKHSPTHCTAPHVAIWANITPRELKAMMTERDVSNGFLNRFLFVWAERTGLVPIPDRMPETLVDDFAAKTRDVARWARGNYPDEQNTRRMTLTNDAQALFIRVYSSLCDGDAPERVATLLERAAPYSLRLAMLFAITDLTLSIDVQHLRAALAWIAYCTDSVTYIFATEEEQLAHRQLNDNAVKLLDWLRSQPDQKATRTSVIADCFNGHITRSKLNDLLQTLAADGKVIVAQEGETGKGKRRTTTVSVPC